MPAKKPAPKAAKGKKAASRSPARKPMVVRKPTAERIKAAPAAHVRQTAAAPKKAVPPRSTPTTEDTIEMRKAVEPVPETPAPASGASNQIVVPPRVSPALAAADTDDSDSAEPGSLLAGPRNVQP